VVYANRYGNVSSNATLSPSVTDIGVFFFKVGALTCGGGSSKSARSEPIGWADRMDYAKDPWKFVTTIFKKVDDGSYEYFYPAAKGGRQKMTTESAKEYLPSKTWRSSCLLCWSIK
jgi:hypothetical protein